MNSVFRASWGGVVVLACALAACSSSKSGGSSGGSGGGDSAGKSDGSSGDGTGEGSGDSPSAGTTGTAMTIPHVPGQVDPNAPADTKLPPLPAMVNVTANAIGDSVAISFDPIDGAVDYRVYELPANDDISSTADGQLTVKNATYRCAGNRQAPAATMDGATQVQSGAIKTLVDGQSVEGYTRSLADATLGYVYAVPGDGRVPVYALGSHDHDGDDSCYFMRWGASRVKSYVTSSDSRDTLLKGGARDDGIAFYVPSASSADTVQVSTAKQGGSTLYFADGAEASMRQGAKPAFFVLSKQADGTVPLKRVFYQNSCGQSHDELVTTDARFQRVRKQGDQVPLFDLHWSGLSGPTKLVVEALDQGCPYQAQLSSVSAAGYSDPDGAATYPDWKTVADARAASETSEVFINGQFEGKPNPRPIARSFISISPAPAPDLDWSYGFKADDTLGTFADVGCGVDNCFQQFRQQSDVIDTVFMFVETKRHAQGIELGELWVTYADLGADVNGKMRMTAKTKADMTADSFVYVTMEANAFSTRRRYPQILISDRDAPVQVNMATGNTLVVQPFDDWPNQYQLEVCDHIEWDTNKQCPLFDMYHQLDPNDPSTVTGLAPTPEVGEHVGVDRSTRFEVYASTKRVYLLLDGEPYGCANLPTAGVPQGASTITFGDVLYHSDADHVFDYTYRKLRWETARHFDNLGFKSHVAAPDWDESRFPCTSHMTTE